MVKTVFRPGSALWNYSNRQYVENRELLLSKIVKMEVIEDNYKILDIGCGDGWLLNSVGNKINKSVELYGIDLAKIDNDEINFIHANCDAPLPIKDNSIDLVISNQVAEHLINTDIFFSEIHRILKANGVAIISTANLSSFQNIFFILLGLQPRGYHTSKCYEAKWNLSLYGSHIKLFNIESLGDIVEYHSLNKVGTYGSGVYPFPISISKLLSKKLKRWTTFIAIIVKK